MKKSGPTIAFVIVCIGAIIAACGIGLGIRRIRFTGAEGQAKMVTKSKKPAEEPAKDKVAAKPSTTPEIPGESQDRPSPEEESRAAMSKRLAGEWREARPQLSEEDSAKLREEMHVLMDRAKEMTAEERKKAQAEIFEKYGLPSR